jgi:hypothetical protein
MSGRLLLLHRTLSYVALAAIELSGCHHACSFRQELRSGDRVPLWDAERQPPQIVVLTSSHRDGYRWVGLFADKTVCYTRQKGQVGIGIEFEPRSARLTADERAIALSKLDTYGPWDNRDIEVHTYADVSEARCAEDAISLSARRAQFLSAWLMRSWKAPRSIVSHAHGWTGRQRLLQTGLVGPPPGNHALIIAAGAQVPTWTFAVGPAQHDYLRAARELIMAARPGVSHIGQGNPYHEPTCKVTDSRRDVSVSAVGSDTTTVLGRLCDRVSTLAYRSCGSK